MELPHIFKSREKEYRVLKWLLFAFVVSFLFFVVTEPYHRLFYDIEALRGFIEGFGVLAPLALIVFQVGQVLIAPIPGPVVGATAGYIFGAFWGTIYGFIGLAAGSTIAILLAKRYGRSFVEDVVAEDKMEKFHGVAENHGFLPFLLMFLLPGFPDDAICFVAGLTDLDTKKLVVYASLGRVPGLLSLTFFGDSLALSNYRAMFLISGLVVLVSVSAWYVREHVVRPGENVRNPLVGIKEKLEEF